MPSGYDDRRRGDVPDGAEAVIVATHGRDEVAALVHGAVRSGAAYVGLVASPARGAGVVDRARPATPPGRHAGRPRHRSPHTG